MYVGVGVGVCVWGGGGGDLDNDARFAKYRTFKIGDSASNYTLTVSGYSGTAGDHLTTVTRNFSTRDHDNDVTADYGQNLTDTQSSPSLISSPILLVVY